MYLDNYRNSLPPLCRKYHVDKLYAFGSVLTDRFGPDSDVDLIAHFDRPAVEDLFSRPVDLLADQPVSNPVFRQRPEAERLLG
jgi:predicted nucleotidyltransferase